jgi:hypothetical protein
MRKKQMDGFLKVNLRPWLSIAHAAILGGDY